ncbi:hypothetical protein RZS08_44185, partial [Arthrospira platensis SPKY1]|nr:hypothetical protein [Arthrospira platensis SPKY1]
MFKEKTIYVCSYSDLETLFAEHFAELEDYCFVSDNEASNGSNHSFTVTGLESAASLEAIQT